MMIANRYIAILDGRKDRSAVTRHFYASILNYLDDRNWPVTVWYHQKLSGWIRQSKFMAGIYYAIVLCLTPRSVIVVEDCLLGWVLGALGLSKKVIHHDIIISVREGFKEKYFRKKRMWRRAFRVAKWIVVDSYATKDVLTENGLGINKIRVLPAVHDLPVPIQPASVFWNREISEQQFETVPSTKAPGSLMEAIEQLESSSEPFRDVYHRLN